MDDVRVNSWNELNDRLFAGAWQEPMGRFRSTFAFRGVSLADVDLTTTLIRLGEPFGRQEGHLLRNFRKYATRDAVPGESVWNWLALAQHHGLPTRMLDWTFSPFVAMHFATMDSDDFDRDGAIWCVDYVKVHSLLPRELKKVLKDEDADVFTAEMLSRVAGTLPEFDALSGKDDFTVFLEPPSLDDRIVNQFALFSMMSSPVVRLHDWLADRPGLGFRIILPAALKWEVRDKLDQANITERVLFPGLDGLSRWLKRYYTPKKPTTDADRHPSGEGDESHR
ncbi:MAG TPA: FRG domain-containing protein [Tepidisphaeraceae bacterium]|nr:FRG domain-containing protein [Tepidisphaeraceae bacterium]